MNLFPPDVLAGYAAAVLALAGIGFAAWCSSMRRRRRREFEALYGLLAELSPEPARPVPPPAPETDLDRQFAGIIHATWGVRPGAHRRPAPRPRKSTSDTTGGDER